MQFLKKIYNKLSSGDVRSVALKKNIVLMFIIKGLSISMSLLLVPLTIGYVSADLYGVWLSLSSIQYWVQFLDLGFSSGLKNKLTEAIARNDWKKAKSLVSTTYVIITAIFVPFGILLCVFLPDINWSKLLNIDPIYNTEIIKALYAISCFVCMQMIFNILTVVVSSFQKVAFSSVFSVVGQVLSFIIILILTKTVPPSLIWLAVAYGGMPVLSLIVFSIILYSTKYKSVRPSFRCFDKSLVKGLLNLGIKFFIINIQIVVIYQTTNILISNVSSPIEVTSYNIAYRYLNIAMLAYSLITTPLWPAYTDAYVKGDFIWMNNIRRKMTRIYQLSILACCLMALGSPLFYKIWIGNKVAIPFTMTGLVTIYVILYCWMTLNGTLIVGMGKIKLETILVVIGMIIHIPLALCLGSIVGAYGVVISMIVINFIYALTFKIQVDKILSKRATGIWNK